MYQDINIEASASSSAVADESFPVSMKNGEGGGGGIFGGDDEVDWHCFLSFEGTFCRGMVDADGSSVSSVADVLFF